MVQKVNVTPNIKTLKKLSVKLFKAGYDLKRYEVYLNNKIEKEKKFYKNLTNEDIEYLLNNFKKIETYFNNLNAMKYEDIKFRKKQKRNYNEKKNGIIHSEKLNKQNELKVIAKNNTKYKFHEWENIYNLLYQYNKVVPRTYSKESMRDFVYGG